jgi:hypothetical protein
MRKLIIAAAALGLGVFATPALAGTLQEITTHGMVVTIADMSFDLNFTPDGKFTDSTGQLTGTWKIDGAKMCTSSNLDPNETCAEYPADKKSGDTFDLDIPAAGASIKIHIK